MRKNTLKFLIPVLIISILIAPAFALAAEGDWKGLVPCGKEVVEGVVTEADQCGFNDFMELINKVLGFLLTYLVLPIAAIMFAYAGFKLVISGGNTEARGTAKKVFSNTVIGLIIILLAFLIIRTILFILGYEGAWIFEWV
ncbi:hypothetical protein A3G06_01555 [Candidatus Nomurabacteria bacterium RIFCSPLOWO2_12_FULL_46_14]|uniref:Uncharacterized protein n=1 Tax=Candidatus Nomurabacteria bacterium RIFCSPLOWO2_12_FULL_46_14 TaxID=1801797 RepID=A0A1F6YC12_9BACT|nr:MAG: hypothetical protein A3G06_01555 [Candidatus Nomurabacteria bacterium RIFCSPLOWO2_12_FULL_46_14]